MELAAPGLEGGVFTTGPQGSPSYRLWSYPSVSLSFHPSTLVLLIRFYSLEGLMLKLKLPYFGHLCKELTHWKRPWCWERLRAGGEGGNRGWDDWMVSPTWWTWVWASSGRWRRTGKPGVLQSMRWKRVEHDLSTEQQQNELPIYWPLSFSFFINFYLFIFGFPGSSLLCARFL